MKTVREVVELLLKVPQDSELRIYETRKDEEGDHFELGGIVVAAGIGKVILVSAESSDDFQD